MSDRAFLVLCDATGRVYGTTACSGLLRDMQPALHEDDIVTVVSEETHRAVSARPEDWRVLGGELVQRPAMEISADRLHILSDGVDVLTLTGLPDPCRVRCRGSIMAPWTEVTGGRLELTTTTPGAFVVRIEAPLLWRPWEAVFGAD